MALRDMGFGLAAIRYVAMGQTLPLREGQP
jgi:hypothetical protein